jgi:putative ABC transport system substrate-binding protein
MHRRRFLALLGAAITAARTLRAQQKPMPVIGFLTPDLPGSVASFEQGLNETGHVPGRNLVIEYRGAEFRYDQLPSLAADLVGRKVDVIVAPGTPAALAAKSATSTIPIVFFSGDDPVAQGLVASFPRPGGNLTGFTAFFAELMPKRLELLSEVVPQATMIALLLHPAALTAGERVIKDLQGAASANAELD